MKYRKSDDFYTRVIVLTELYGVNIYEKPRCVSFLTPLYLIVLYSLRTGFLCTW